MNPLYLKRVAEGLLQRYIGAFPVVGITGPRQSGKSTLLQHSLPDYEYVTFDDPINIERFENDPAGFMREHPNRVIFDEVQYVPEIFNYIKLVVDKDRHNYGKFVLTGSSQFHFIKEISESLAGRIGLFTLLPFQFLEVPETLRSEAIYKGCYPEIVERKYQESELWYAAYFDTYLNKDVRMLTNIGDIRDFRRFIGLLAANTSQTLDMTSYSRDIGVSVTTIKRWLSVLEASYIIFLLPPFYKNFGKRIVKSPKIYFYDTGLVSYLTGIKTKELYEKGPMAGALYENYIVSEILKLQFHNKTNSDLYYLRTSDKQEIDLILDLKTHNEFIEIKKSVTFKPKMLETIKKFIEKDDKGFLLYDGKDVPSQHNINIINYTEYLSKTFE